MAKKKEPDENVGKDGKLLKDLLPVGELPIEGTPGEKLVEVDLKHKHRINGRAFEGRRLLPEELAGQLMAADEKMEQDLKKG